MWLELYWGCNVRKLDWTDVYTDTTLTAETLSEARETGKSYYRNVCPIHGRIPYRTMDNTCPLCTRDRSKERRKSDNSMFHNIRELVTGCIRRSKLSKQQATITTDDIRKMVPALCPVFGSDMTTHGDKVTSPSIDRLDPLKGYTKDNVRVISSRANRVKSDGSAREHLQIALWMMRESGMSETDLDHEIDVVKRIDNSSEYQLLTASDRNVETKSKIFTERAIAIHGTKYDYSKVRYESVRKKVTVCCPKHGDWDVLPSNHLTNRSGCPKCRKRP